MAVSNQTQGAAYLQRSPPSAQIEFIRKTAFSIFPKRPSDRNAAVERLVPTYAFSQTGDVLERRDRHPLWHYGALALSCWDKLLVHRLDPKVVEYVRTYRLGSVPDAAPYLLTQPWLIEVPRVDKGHTLFGDTVALGSYYVPEADQWFLMGWTLASGIVGNTGAFWPQDWNGGPLAQMDVAEIGVEWQGDGWGLGSKKLGPLDKGQLWFNQAVQFATVFAVLMEAAHSGLHTRDERNGPAPPKERRPGIKHLGWTTRHVYLDQKTLAEPAPLKEPEKLALSATSAASESSRSIDGKSLQDVMVHEHQRRQRFGKGLSQFRWVCIKGYQSKRWTSANPVRVVVRMKPEQ